MKQLNKISNGTPLNFETLLDFQMNNSLTLPGYLIDFFINYNGSETKECLFDTKYIVNNFLPLLKERNASVELILPALTNPDEGICRKDLIPFAIDPGGRPFYVSIGVLDNGSVFIDRIGMGHKTPLLKIADSFEEFINGLQPEKS